MQIFTKNFRLPGKKTIGKAGKCMGHATGGFFLGLCLLIPRPSPAQHAIFLTHGRIEFAKKESLWAQVDEDADADWRDLEKKILPQFKTTYFDLVFDHSATLYKPGRENPDNNKIWQTRPAEDNIVFNNLSNRTTVTQKNVYELTFLVKDSIRNIKWKLTSETRNIAGFTCRRANGIIMDSIYVVAFYTDEIPLSGGPECFTGLPGMILGLALPHEHVTWFATSVYTDAVPATELVPPEKGEKTTNARMLLKLQDLMKDWGKWALPYIRSVML